MKRRFTPLALMALMCAACSDNNLPKYDELKGLRVLALIASQPEVDAGGSTTITPIVSDIQETTALTYESIGCIALTSVDTSCAGNPTATALQNGTLNSGDMVVGRSFTGAATTINVTIPNSTTIFNQRSTQDQFNGVTYLVTYTLKNSRGESLQSYRRILVSTRPGAEKNQNPVLNDVLADGAALTTTLPAGQKLNLRPSFGAVTAEAYRVQESSGNFRNETEELITTWFITDGEMKYYRSVSGDENIFTAPDALPSGRDTLMIAVTRDGRGGLAYKRKCFGTCP